MPIILFPMTADCPPLCALRFPDRPWKSWECTESIGDPMTNYGDMEEYKRIYLQFYVNTTGPCYVCQASNATTLLEPCKPCPAAQMSEGGVPWESNDPRYSTLSSCATPGSMSECAKAEIPNYKLAVTAKANDKFCLGDQSCSLDSDNPLAFRTPFAPTPDINFRGIQPLIMLGIGVLYLGQAIGCLATACCLQSFKECVCVVDCDCVYFFSVVFIFFVVDTLFSLLTLWFLVVFSFFLCFFLPSFLSFFLSYYATHSPSYPPTHAQSIRRWMVKN